MLEIVKDLNLKKRSKSDRLMAKIKTVEKKNKEDRYKGLKLLRFCEANGLTYREGIRHISNHIRHMEGAPWRYQRDKLLKVKAAKWDA